MKVIIGAGNTQQRGWISTQEDQLNLLDDLSWENFFKSSQASAFLAEHVWEHMTYQEGVYAAKMCFKYLKPGGYLRIAVPDKNFKHDAYQEMVQIGGPGPSDHPASSHKIVYDYRLISSLLIEAGFTTNLLEYCDERSRFHYKYWNENDGKIGRSFRYDTRNSLTSLGMVSIVIDAHKPLIISEY